MQRGLVLFALATICGVVLGSSHSEAPGTAKQPAADGTDFYMFNSYEAGRDGYVTLIHNVYGVQYPGGGPNYFSLSDGHFYEIYIDNTGDGVEDITFQWIYGTQYGGPAKNLPVPPTDTDCKNNSGVYKVMNGGIELNINNVPVPVPLKFVGPITAADQSALNWLESYSVEVIRGTRDSSNAQNIYKAGDSSFVSFTKPMDYAGMKTFPNYDAYANQYIYDITIPGCNTNGRMFVGQRREGFAVALGAVFDLINFVPVAELGGVKDDDKNNDLFYKNVNSFIIEVHKSCLLGTSGDVIGAWSGIRQLLHDNSGGHMPGRQVHRLGAPLVNELFIGIRDKWLFAASQPKDDAQWLAYVQYPSLPAIIDILFRGAVNAATNKSLATIAPNTPRADLVAAFLTGVPGLNKPPGNPAACEILRLNTTIPAVPAANQNNMGVIAGDAAGFPNGRRPGDDTVDIALRVVMGKLCYLGLGVCTPADAPVGAYTFLDGAPVNASYFLSVFPYLKTPVPGYPFPPPLGCPVCQICTTTPLQTTSVTSSGSVVEFSFVVMLFATLLLLL